MESWILLARDRIPQAPWFPSFMAMLYIFGCRVSEALTLTVMDLRTGPLYFWAKIPTLKKKKGPPWRQLKVRPDTAHLGLIKKHWEPLAEQAILEEIPRTSPVWVTNRFTVQSYLKKMDPDLSAHKFRHTRLMKLAGQTDNPFELRDWAGWSSLGPAEFYIQSAGVLAQQLGERVVIT